MNLFLDTNILIDITANRVPFSAWAIKIFKDAKNKNWVLYTSSNSILTCFYILEKEIGPKEAKRVIRVLINRMEIQDISKLEMLNALSSSFKDYEDAVQHECAKLCNNIDYIITRNKRISKTAS